MTRLIVVVLLCATAVSAWGQVDTVDGYRWIDVNDKEQIVVNWPMFGYEEWVRGEITYREYLDLRLSRQIVRCSLFTRTIFWNDVDDSVTISVIEKPWSECKSENWWHWIPTPTELLAALHIWRHLTGYGMDWECFTWPRDSMIFRYDCADTACQWREVRP